MVRTCAAQFCSNSCGTGHSIHGFPKEPGRRQTWKRFVDCKRANFNLSKDSVLCSAHFAAECYVNAGISEWSMHQGYSKRLVLKSDAIPTIHATPTQSQLDRARGVKRKCGPHRDSDSSTSRSSRSSSTDKMTCSRSRASSKLEVARLLTSVRQHDNSPAVDYKIAHEDDSDSSTSVFTIDNPMIIEHGVNKSTQTVVHIDTTKRKHFKSQGITVSPMMRDMGTQYDPPIDSYPIATAHNPHVICTSTPQKGEVSNIQYTVPISPIALSEPSSDEDQLSPDVSMYEPTDLSFAEARKETEYSSAGDLDDTHSITRKSERTYKDYEREAKYLVFETELLNLFELCPVCGWRTARHVKGTRGTMVMIEQECLGEDCMFSRVWCSQPFIKNMPAGNMVVIAAMLLSGSLPGQILRMFSFMHMASFNRTTFDKHQNAHVIPAIVRTFQRQQGSLILQLKDMEGGLDLAGDGRSDSPGHSAKYGGYNIIEQRLNKVLDIQLVQSNEVGSSNACELEGLKRSIRFLTEINQLNLDMLITDRHRGIRAYIRDKLIKKNPKASNMVHWFDAWHVGKTIKKKMSKIAKKRDCQEVGAWKKSVINHMYYVASTAKLDENRSARVGAMWLSVGNHIQNVHHHETPLYQMCSHSPIADDDRSKAWLEPGTEACELTIALIQNKALVKDIQMISPTYQTSSLEAFHSLLIRYAPKHTHFGWLSMLARYYIAALHYNENSNRPQAITKQGELQYSIHFPKAKKGEYIIRPRKVDPTYDFVTDIMQDLLTRYSEDRIGLKNSIQDIRNKKPNTLASSMVHPNKDEAVQAHRTRFPNLQ